MSGCYFCVNLGTSKTRNSTALMENSDGKAQLIEIGGHRMFTALTLARCSNEQSESWMGLLCMREMCDVG